MSRIGVILSQASPAAVASIRSGLELAGVGVTVIVPECQVLDLATLRPEHDGYLLLSSAPLAVGLAGALSIRGARILNPMDAVVLAADPVVSTVRLAARGIPVLPTWVSGEGAALAPILTGTPLVAQPHPDATSSWRARLVSPADAAAYGAPHDRYGLPLPFLAVPDQGDGAHHLRVLVAGTEVEFPALAARFQRIAAGIRGLAIQSVRALGLSFGAVEFRITEAQLFVTRVRPGLPLDLSAAVMRELARCAVRSEAALLPAGGRP